MVFSSRVKSGCAGRVTALYAVIPYDGRLSVVILPERYYESAALILGETYAFLNGETAALDRYFLVTGTTAALDETSAGMFYDWFGENRDWLAESGLVSAGVEDYAEVLSPVALRVDTVGKLPNVWAWVLTGLAWGLLIWCAVILLRWSLGKYSPKPEAETADGELTETEEETETEAEAEPEPEEESDAT